MTHRNIPIFIPHMGCPHQCVFCNQRSISGCMEFDEAEMDLIIRNTLSTLSREDDVEIAFFGGSFTGIDRDLMIRLLDRAERYVKEGSVKSIRLSTRPDYISPEILEILSRYSVKHIELGLQSMDDTVLASCKRGHTRKQAMDACRAVVNAGFSLTGQMMIGLPNATPDSEAETAGIICDLGAQSARIYPTVVFYHTPLADMTQKRLYQPLSVQDAAERSAEALRVFLDRHVEVIRIGLCATESLTSSEQVLAGPNHPALGELVWNEYYYQQIYKIIKQKGLFGKEVSLTVPTGQISKVIGQRRSNLQKIFEKTQTRIVKVSESRDIDGILILPRQSL